MTKRVLLKWLHWSVAALMLYFFLVEPEVETTAPLLARSEGLSTHAGTGMLLACLTLVWMAVYARGGPLGRPGPKLPAWAKHAHRAVNTGLYILLPATVISGAVAGLASDYPVMGFGVIPLIPLGWGNATLHSLAEDVHEFVFDVTLLAILAHAAFHIWRHYMLRDNALRIMAPKRLHPYL